MKATKKNQNENETGQENATKGLLDCITKHKYIICMVNESMPGDAPAMCVRHGLMKGFSMSFGGSYVRGRSMTMVCIECPEGDVELARREIVGRVPMFTATSMGLAEKAAGDLSSLAKEKRLAGMGILPLRWALDRTGARYDVFDADSIEESIVGAGASR